MPRFPHRSPLTCRGPRARRRMPVQVRQGRDRREPARQAQVWRRPVARHRRLRRTVLPQLERALLAGHDVVLLGERGQGKTRCCAPSPCCSTRTPVIDGAELPEHPLAPITPASKRRAAELGDELPVRWVHRSERYAEKLATPDTAVGDLVGDVDPVRSPRAAAWATRRRSTSAWYLGRTAASSRSTSCRTWPSGSRWRC